MKSDIKDLIKKTSTPSKRVFVNRNKFDDQNKRAVIYSRVSTKNQEDNTSLAFQITKMKEMAKSHDLQVVEEFGGTFESAKNMDRKEFIRLQKYIKNKNNNIAYVIFYHIDRFSRDYKGIDVMEEWRKKYKIRTLSVTNPTIPSTDLDFISQNQNILNSYAENIKRRDNTLNGNINKLREGYWTGKVRVGYKRVWQGFKKSKIVKDENARFIKLIFELRGNQRMEVPNIYRYIKSMGCDCIKEKNIYKILEQEFYCGYYTHGLLQEGEVIKGLHEPIVSEELFRKVNAIGDENYRKVTNEFLELSLKSFIKCDTCGKNLTGYYKADKDKYYYKCNTKGCRFNKSSLKMEASFITLLQCLKLTTGEKECVRAELMGLTGDFVAKNDQLNKKLKGNLMKLEDDLKKVKVRRAKDEIDQDIYLTAREEISKEIDATIRDLKKTESKISNFSEKIDKALQMLDSIDVLWKNNSVDGRKRVQKALIKTPLVFDRKKGQYRTFGLIDFVRSNAVLARVSEVCENKNPQQIAGDSPVVACTGIEPVIPP